MSSRPNIEDQIIRYDGGIEFFNMCPESYTIFPQGLEPVQIILYAA